MIWHMLTRAYVDVGAGVGVDVGAGVGVDVGAGVGVSVGDGVGLSRAHSIALVVAQIGVNPGADVDRHPHSPGTVAAHMCTG